MTCKKCAHFKEKFMKKAEYVPVGRIPVKKGSSLIQKDSKFVKRIVFKDYCSVYKEIIRNIGRAEKCKRFVEKVERGALNEFMEEKEC
jgi:hypothetical protein